MKNIFQTLLTAVLIGVLVGVFGSMMFFNSNEFQSVFIFYPLVNFLIGMLSYIIFKRVWIGSILTLVGGIISSVVFMNQTFWMWIIIYTFVSMLGSILGLGIEKIKYSKIRATLKVLISITGVIITVISLLGLTFIYEMTPDKSKEKQIIEQAKKYLEDHYNVREYAIYDVLYDNMGNFTKFDYAAKVRNLKTGGEFLIYYNEQVYQMEDSLRYELE